jgi:hypothetical protein
MNPPQQLAAAISFPARKGFEIAKWTLEQLRKIIGKPMAASEGFFTFRGPGLQSPVPVDRPEQNSAKNFQKSLTMHEKISTYADLQKLIHDALRLQHPEWIGLDGQSELCEFYEARFAQLLDGTNPPPNASSHAVSA